MFPESDILSSEPSRKTRQFFSSNIQLHFKKKKNPTRSLGMFASMRRIPQAAVQRGVSMQKTSAMSTIVLPDLTFDYGALEPIISAEIMQIHHTKHHAAYVANFNIANAKLEEAQHKGDISSIISLQNAIKFNGGGHVNHSIFWKNLAPITAGGGELPPGDLRTLIEAQYGTLENLQTIMTASTVGVQGSGWGWLGYDKASKKLVVTTTANQDPLFATTGLVPILGIDVWEHAYYLVYKNVRPDYVKMIWKIINWKDCAERLAEAKK